MKSLSVTSLDLGRCLAGMNGVTFRVSGTCMYPNIRPGDVLTIQPCFVADLLVGDIAVCRSSDFLFAHRVIEKGENKGRAFIVTRSDRNRTGNDMPIYDENFLGIVSAITRNGKSINFNNLIRSVPVRQYYDLAVALIDAKEDLKKFLIYGVGLSVKSRPGKFLSQLWMRTVCPHIGYSVRIPLNGSLGDSVCRVFDPDLFNPDGRFNGKQTNSWILALHLNNDRDPAAWIVLTRNLSGTSPWRIDDSHTRTRYRGADLHEKLEARAQTIIGATFS